jgi:hypothetical protein
MSTRAFTDRRGKVWTLTYDAVPAPCRDMDWSATDEDYDGAPDSYSRGRVARGATAEKCIADILRILDEEGES